MAENKEDVKEMQYYKDDNIAYSKEQLRSFVEKTTLYKVGIFCTTITLL